MAVTGDTLTTANLGLKTFFRKKLIRDIPDEVPFFTAIKDKTKNVTVGGRSLQATWAIETQRGSGYNVFSEGGDLATPRAMAFANYTQTLAHYSVGFEFTGHLEAAGKSDPYTYIGGILMKLTDETKRTMTRLLGISVMNDGTAVLGQITAISTNVLTIGSTQIAWFEPGMFLTVRDTTTSGSEQLTSAQPASGKITAVDYANSTVEIADATGASVNDYVAIYGLYDQTLIQGIRSLVDNSGTVQGVDRSTAGNEFAESWELAAGGAAISESLIQQLNDLIFKFSRHKKAPKYYLTDADSVRWAFLSLVGRQRYADTDGMVGGYETVKFHTGDGPRELIKDPNAYPAETYALCLDDFGLLRPETGTGSGWFEVGGNVLHAKTGSAANGVYADAKQGWWIERIQLICDIFRNQAKLTGYVSP